MEGSNPHLPMREESDRAHKLYAQLVGDDTNDCFKAQALKRDMLQYDHDALLSFYLHDFVNVANLRTIHEQPSTGVW